jgi:hypothetical protein
MRPLPARGEKFPEQLRGLVRQHPRNHRGAVIELGMVEYRKAGTHSAPFHVVGAVYKARNASLDHGSGTHGARLYGDVDSGAGQPVVSNGARGLAKRDDFGVRGGIAIRNGAVSGAGNDALADHYGRAHGDLAALRRSPCFVKRGTHVELVDVVLLVHGQSE